MKKFSLQATVIIVGIVIGGATGGYLTFHRYARDYAIVRAFAWTGIVSAVSANQYDMNTSDTKTELLYTLDFYSQGVGSSAIDASMKNALRMNRGLTEARISVLENEAGNVDLSKTYLAKAQDDLKDTGWVDYSESNILQAVKRETVVPCGTVPQNAAKTNTTSKPCG